MMTKNEMLSVVLAFPRKKMVCLLERAGIACYDHESKEVLAEAIVVNLLDGTIRDTTGFDTE